MVKNTEKKTKKLPTSPSSQIFSCLSYLPIHILYNVFLIYFFPYYLVYLLIYV